MTTLSHELQKRGHKVTLFASLDEEAKSLDRRLEFYAIGKDKFPLGVLAKHFEELGKLSGLSALQYTIKRLAEWESVILRDLPTAIEKTGVNALLVDQASRSGGSVAEVLDIPFITICNALILHLHPSVPPFNTTWQYSHKKLATVRNVLAHELLKIIGKPIIQTIGEYRRQHNLSFHATRNDAYSPIAQISQQPEEFEFPRQDLPPWFHFTGPLHNQESRAPVSFPFEKLNGKPLIYASMGTLQNRLLWVFEKIASACEGLDAQLVISLGGSASIESLPQLPGNPIVVKYAPQLELLQKAKLTITHAGMNTALESLNCGVPMVAIPVTNDQPGVAARIAWTGTGEVITLNKLDVVNLRSAIIKVMQEERYTQNALRLQKAIQRSGGVSRAADIIEQAVTTRKPVIAGSMW